MHGLIRWLAAGLTAACFSPTAWAPVAWAQAPGLGASIELVDPHVLRVCADPRNLPFSNQAGEGFENKLADLIAGKLNRPVSYTYFPETVGFFRNTLNAFKCDVVMGVAVGVDLVQTTNPYYRSTYVLMYRSGAGLDGVDTIEDPRLHGKHVGIIAGTPPSILLLRSGLMASAVPYQLTVDTRYDAPAKSMIEDLSAGKIDAAVVWGPIGGYYAQHVGAKLTVVPLVKEHGVPMDFRIALGVRHSDQAWKRTLNGLIAQNQPEIDKLLVSYGVPLLDGAGKVRTP